MASGVCVCLMPVHGEASFVYFISPADIHMIASHYAIFNKEHLKMSEMQRTHSMSKRQDMPGTSCTTDGRV